MDDVCRHRHPDQAELGLNETQFGILVATPVLTGSLIRLPLGMWTDRFGGRIVFFILMLSTVIPIWMISGPPNTGISWCSACSSAWPAARSGRHRLPRAGSENRQGLAMGIFGVGNTGRRSPSSSRPTIVVAYGWAMVPKVYAALMLVTGDAFLVAHIPTKAHTAALAR